MNLLASLLILSYPHPMSCLAQNAYVMHMFTFVTFLHPNGPALRNMHTKAYKIVADIALGMANCHGSCTAQNRKALQQVINRAKNITTTPATVSSPCWQKIQKCLLWYNQNLKHLLSSDSFSPPTLLISVVINRPRQI